jgi:hypothetical protein
MCSPDGGFVAARAVFGAEDTFSMPAAIQMMAALGLFMVAVVALLVSIVIGVVFARMIYGTARWVVKLLNEPAEDGIVDAADAFPTVKTGRVPALPSE